MNITIWKRMMGYMRPYRRKALVALIGLLIGNILMIAIPAILRDVIDVGIENNDSNFMVAAGFLVVGLGVMRGIVGFLSRYFGERLSHEIAYDIRNQYYNKVQSLAFSYHDTAEVGTLITRAISDVAEIQRYFAFALVDGLNTLFLFTGVAVIMAVNSPPLAAIALLPMIPLGYLSRSFIMNIAPRWKTIMEETQTLSNHLQENALGAEVVRVFAREKFEINRFGIQNEKLYHEQLGFIQQWASYLPSSAFIVASSTALVLFFGGLMERNGIGNVTVGLVVSFNAYVLLLAQPMRFLGFVILLTTQAISSSERVFEIFDTPDPLINKADAPLMPTIKGHVRFENVNFTYDGAERPVLHDINIEAQPGQIIALLGATGSGKTSVINLIARFYDVTAGRVTIDDIDVQDVNLHTLRSQIGIVLQNSLLFSATIHDNIAYGKPDASPEQVIAAATAANAHDFITEFPNGYDTLVGERGVTLSGGQRQRVAIARALLIAPNILILDDATSSVDTQTEYLIQRALNKLMEGRTSFVIAQRLSTVLNANQILVLDAGRIIERGTHQELLALNGAYKEIYDLQLAEQERLRREESIAGDFKPQRTTDKLATQELQAIADRLASGD